MWTPTGKGRENKKPDNLKTKTQAGNSISPTEEAQKKNSREYERPN